MTLRPAQGQDAAQMAAILSGWIDETPWMPRLHSHAGDLAFVTRQVPCSVVWERGGAVAGFLTRDAAEIECLYVAARHRGCGVGAGLLRHAKSVSAVLRLWTFQANAGAQRFYVREGFAAVTRTPGAGNDEKLPDVRFEWRKGEDAG